MLLNIKRPGSALTQPWPDPPDPGPGPWGWPNPEGQGQGQQKRPRPGLARPLVSVVTMDKMIYEILYHFNQFVSHASHLFFFFDHGFKFFFNLPDFLRSFENLKSHVTDELIKMAQ